MPVSERKPEGFRGQRLVVLPAPVRQRSENHPLLRGLLVTDAGIFPQAKAHFIERPNGAPTTLLIVCLAGRGWVRLGLNEPTLSIVPGMLVWLPDQRPHAYGADEADPWSIEWVHFQGEEVNSWRDLLGISLKGGLLVLSTAAAAELRLGQVWAHLDHGYTPANLAAASAALRTSLAAAAQKRFAHEGLLSSQERVAASIAWMKNHLTEPLRLAELASFAGLSIPHYTALFRRHSGFSPMDMFTRLRVQWACEILDTTQTPIAEIARQAGFADPYYFTRCFRRVVGLPPRKYRRVPKG
jgi:AraC family transcriptional regulator, arabinose operon regulatory protein